jgi:glucose-1-phosphate cytidylyltransferase|tara:strand:- start:8268 stop:8963 length:696 start_codon:yes stop_codon:yes gene_type:complete
MKVAILCGGKGTRFQGGEGIPKPMARIGGLPILEHIMKIYSYHGYDDFILLLGYKERVITDYFSEVHPDWNIDFKFTGLDSNTAERVFKAKTLLNERFFLTYGDGLADINLEKEIEFHEKHKGIGTITVTPMPSQYGIVVSSRKGRIQDFQEKPILKDRWINGGFFIFEPDFFDYARAKDLERDVLPKMAEKGVLYAFKHTGFWKCMDQHKDYTELNNLWKKNKANWAMWK